MRDIVCHTHDNAHPSHDGAGPVGWGSSLKTAPQNCMFSPPAMPMLTPPPPTAGISTPQRLHPHTSAAAAMIRHACAARSALDPRPMHAWLLPRDSRDRRPPRALLRRDYVRPVNAVRAGHPSSSSSGVDAYAIIVQTRELV